MRRSRRSCCRPRPEIAARLLLALPLAFVLACVTRGTHQEVLEERDRARAEVERLAERLRRLELSTESLSAERVELLEATEDLRQARGRLEEELGSLRAEREALAEELARREEELAAQRREVQKLRGTYDALVEELESEVAAGQVQIQRLREGIRVNLAQEILFPSGSADLSVEGRAVLERVAGRLASLPNPVEVQGHTDDRPIHGRLARTYPSNWELGAARASSVVRLLEGAGVARGRLYAVSFADTRPVAPNDSAEGRARNRRIEIRLLPAPRAEEAAPEQAAGEGRAGDAAPEGPAEGDETAPAARP